MEPGKREAILGAAARIFSRQGFKQASVDEIARTAGVAKGTVYLACDSKEDLFYQVVHRELRDWLAETARLIDPRRSADELLAEVSQASLELMAARPLVRDLLFRQHHQILPDWAERLDALRDLARGSTLELVRLGVRQGRFRPDLDVETAASLIQDLQLAAWLFHARPGGDDIAERLRLGCGLLLRGLRPSR